MIKRKDGTLLLVENNLSLVVDKNNNPLYIQNVFRDISERKEIEERLTHIATHDRLTNLPNRYLFYDHLDLALKRAKRQGHKLAVLNIDLNEFKHVNDQFGHAIGDKLLKIVGGRIQDCVRENDILARMGGDEFTVILDSMGNKHTSVDPIVSRITQKLSKQVIIQGNLINISASIGISCYPYDGERGEELVQSADQAMYIAKRDGIARYPVQAAC